ncbi:hypothetical protein MUK42_07667 [Musa troglodytarum]|uniref:Uncharacterized protein n=1 Tax=Musa troglodytarum TaxID=320322 RepID=A0A9E7KUK4_9LILI|nr:hypothetical protein MUK42_07667 [Musa troglodytarum]
MPPPLPVLLARRAALRAFARRRDAAFVRSSDMDSPRRRNPREGSVFSRLPLAAEHSSTSR